MCSICGQPDFVKCNCESAQPFCDQCADDSKCQQEFDAQCVIYHGFDNQRPSGLICLDLPNNTSLEVILDTIDDTICAFQNSATPISVEQSSTVQLIVSGVHNHTLEAQAKISTAIGNQLTIDDTGLLVPAPSYKVKVDEDDVPNFLENQMVGADDGIVSISVVNNAGLLEITPLLNLEGLVEGLCELESFDTCVKSHIEVEDTDSIDLVLDGDFIISANSNISAASGNTIVINADGLYSAGGGTVDDAVNGLNIAVDTVKLGGNLIEHTQITNGSTNTFDFSLNPRRLITGSQWATYHSLAPTGLSKFILDDIQVPQSGTSNNTGASISILTTMAGSISNCSAIFSGLNLGITSNTTVANTKAIASTYNFLSFDPNDTSSNLTFTAGTGGTRAAACSYALVGLPSNSAGTGVLSHVASFLSIGPFNEAGATSLPTITNFYGLLLNPSDQFADHGIITNRWGIYQEGVNDVNRFFGIVQNSGGGTEFTSDIRVKENIEDFTRGLAELEQIKTHKFNYIYNKNRQVTGVIAQELEKIIPEAVNQGNFKVPGIDGPEYTDFRMVEQNILIYTMLNAIKELSAKVKALENNSF